MILSKAGFAALLGVLACSSEPAGIAPPPPPAAQLLVEPSDIVLTAGTAVTYAATLSSGMGAPVSWSLDDPRAGSITSLGSFTHNYCFPGPVFVRARLQGDPTVSGTGRIQIAYNEGAFVALRSIELNNGQPALVDSLTGTVRFVTGLEAKPYPCRTVRKLRMARLVNFDSMTLDSVLFDPPLEAQGQSVLSWQTTTVPNGRYTLSFIASRADGSVETTSFTVTVRNP